MKMIFNSISASELLWTIQIEMRNIEWSLIKLQSDFLAMFILCVNLIEIIEIFYIDYADRLLHSFLLTLIILQLSIFN